MSAEFPFSDLAKRVAGGDPLAVVFGKVQAAAAANPDFISLAAGPPPSDLLPNAELPTLVEAAQQHGGPGFMNYGRPAGLPPLAQVWTRELQQRYGVPCKDPLAETLITSGGMEAISFSLLALVSPGDKVLVESPAFPGTLSAIRMAGGEAVHIACDDEGMVPSALEAALRKYGSHLVTLMPDFQNPTGKVMSPERRRQIADVLISLGAFALEDAVYAPLRFAGEDLPSLYSLAPENVIYVTSVSKSLAPAERVGMLVADPRFVSRVANMKSVVNMQASNMLQGVAAEFMSGQGQQAHLEQLLPRYADRAQRMQTALERYLPECTFTRPEGGMFLWVSAPADIDFTVLMDRAIENGVAYVPGDLFYADGKSGRNQVRLNFASAGEGRIEEAIKRLASTVYGK